MARHEATLHLIDLNSLPVESLHHLHHLLNQLQAPVVASIQSIPFALVQIDNEAFLPVSLLDLYTKLAGQGKLIVLVDSSPRSF